jgi:hypothetical protein
MRSRAHRSESPTSPTALQRHEKDAAFSAPPRRASARAVGASPGSAAPGLASTRPEPPAETDAWWLSRSPEPTFARRRIELAAAFGRSLGASGTGEARIVVEFNGGSFAGAAVTANDGHYELDLGDALAAEMASVLDEDDGLSIEVVSGRAAPTLAIHPYVSDER